MGFRLGDIADTLTTAPCVASSGRLPVSVGLRAREKPYQR